MKVLLAGSFNTYTLETSYKNAFTNEGHEVKVFDLPSATSKYIKFGKIGQLINSFLPVEAWIRKVNRDFVITAKEYQPDIVVTFANAELLPSSIMFLKSILPAKFVLIWPDTVFNLKSHILQSAPLYDYVASYSSTCVKVFNDYGFKKVKWIPLAADPNLHYSKHDDSTKKYDLTFVGGWRPEREKIMSYIVENFEGIKIGIWGPYWDRSSDKNLLKYSNSNALYGKDFTSVIQQSTISMNIIDDTNYPAANMRFFEVPVAAGLEICSSCPEMESTYKNREHMLYYSNEDELKQAIDFALSNKKICIDIIKNAHELTLSKHTYQHRVKEIVSDLW
ncbi:MAG: glycosyltransferase [Bacteroidia bacterium]|jgi:hypothetical protein|nr:glycosyltransferase [Bacteroidia bacterium]MBP7261023.1 glycosyltransferase [Bacteroidia bacterium]MBP9179236.1 glycosyltransferase [Bacteroidia bacterium]MBP9724342.1 glycosyltransferase [Bacteroidia bacterium]